MEEIINKKIEEVYSELMRRPKEVLDIFNDFFGEDRVDMQEFISINELIAVFKRTYISYYTNKYAATIPGYVNNRYKTIYELEEPILNKILDILTNQDVINHIKRRLSEIRNCGFILVHFPYVKVTNEYDRYTEINHLFAKITVSYDGLIMGTFTLNRSEYSLLHFVNDYMHSHIRTIPKTALSVFQTPCLGSGPINSTILSLSKDYDTEIWKLFCLELSKYVEVESIEGVPYHRLGDLGYNTLGSNSRFMIVNLYDSTINKSLLKEFTKYFIRKNLLKYNFNRGSFSIGMGYIEYILTISNEFIDWYNREFNNKNPICKYTVQKLLSDGVLHEVIITSNNIYKYTTSSDITSYKTYIGRKVCTFKGKDVLLNITDDDLDIPHSIVLNWQVALFILTRILQAINYRYGKSNKGLPEHGSAESIEDKENVRYL